MVIENSDATIKVLFFRKIHNFTHNSVFKIKRKVSINLQLNSKGDKSLGEFIKSSHNLLRKSKDTENSIKTSKSLEVWQKTTLSKSIILLLENGSAKFLWTERLSMIIWLFTLSNTQKTSYPQIQILDLMFFTIKWKILAIHKRKNKYCKLSNETTVNWEKKAVLHPIDKSNHMNLVWIVYFFIYIFIYFLFKFIKTNLINLIRKKIISKLVYLSTKSRVLIRMNLAFTMSCTLSITFSYFSQCLFSLIFWSSTSSIHLRGILDRLVHSRAPCFS